VRQEGWCAGRLSRAYTARGQNIWVFRHPEDTELHLEFREAQSREHLAPAGAEEVELDARLASLGRYEHTDVVWEGVSLPEGD
jgi:hypothetical protein